MLIMRRSLPRVQKKVAEFEEIPDLPTAVHPSQHRRHEYMRQIGAGLELPGLDDGCVHGAHDVPAGCRRGIQRVERGAAADHGAKIPRGFVTCPSSAAERRVLDESVTGTRGRFCRAAAAD